MVTHSKNGKQIRRFRSLGYHIHQSSWRPWEDPLAAQPPLFHFGNGQESGSQSLLSPLHPRQRRPISRIAKAEYPKVLLHTKTTFQVLLKKKKKTAPPLLAPLSLASLSLSFLRISPYKFFPSFSLSKVRRFALHLSGSPAHPMDSSVTDSDHPPAAEDDRVFLVPYRWWREAQESEAEDGPRGIPYAATQVSSSYGMKLINNFFSSDLVYNLRRDDDSRWNDAEVGVSGRCYALISSQKWYRALQW